MAIIIHYRVKFGIKITLFHSLFLTECYSLCTGTALLAHATLLTHFWVCKQNKSGISFCNFSKYIFHTHKIYCTFLHLSSINLAFSLGSLTWQKCANSSWSRRSFIYNHIKHNHEGFTSTRKAKLPLGWKEIMLMA